MIPDANLKKLEQPQIFLQVHYSWLVPCNALKVAPPPPPPRPASPNLNLGVESVSVMFPFFRLE
jgi:hypothetical protein